jgi:hypothetical protein
VLFSLVLVLIGYEAKVQNHFVGKNPTVKIYPIWLAQKELEEIDGVESEFFICLSFNWFMLISYEAKVTKNPVGKKPTG